jgi:hypothetical protein
VEAKMGFDLKAHTMKLAMSFTKQAQTGDEGNPGGLGTELLSFPSSVSAQDRAEILSAKTGIPLEDALKEIERSAENARGVQAAADRERAAQAEEALLKSDPSLYAEHLRQARSGAAPAASGGAPVGGGPSPTFWEPSSKEEFVGMTADQARNALAGIEAGQVTPRRLAVLNTLWSDPQSRLGEDEGRQLAQTLMGAVQKNPTLFDDKNFMQSWDLVTGSMGKREGYEDQLKSMQDLASGWKATQSGLAYGGFAPAAAATPAAATPAVAPAPTPTPAPVPAEPPLWTPTPEMPWRGSTTPADAMAGQFLPMAPLPSQGGAGGGLAGATPNIPQLAGPSPEETELKNTIRDLKAGATPKIGPSGASSYGMWVGNTPPIGPGRVGPYATPGQVKEEMLRPVLASIGIFQRGMDKEASALAQDAFQSMMADMAGWAAGEGASELEKIGAEAAAWLPEGEDQQAAVRIAQADALGRIMAASHLSWMLKAAGGGSELSVEEQRQGRSYNNPTGQHLLPPHGFSTDRGEKDDSTSELPVGEHRPDAR